MHKRGEHLLAHSRRRSTRRARRRYRARRRRFCVLRPLHTAQRQAPRGMARGSDHERYGEVWNTSCKEAGSVRSRARHGPPHDLRLRAISTCEMAYGPEPDLAWVADRGEGDPLRCWAVGEVASIHHIRAARAALSRSTAASARFARIPAKTAIRIQQIPQ